MNRFIKDNPGERRFVYPSDAPNSITAYARHQ